MNREEQKGKASKVDHYFSEKQNSSFDPFTIPVTLGKETYQLYSAGGVFSHKHLDKGTEALITYADKSTLGKDSKILDLGCGYGVVGIALLLEEPAREVWFVDTNKRAVALTNMNLDALNLKGTALKSDVFSALNEETFDHILTNPPYAAGREVCFAFIDQSYEHLRSGGSLQLVCRRRKGGDVLEKHMEETFGNVEVVGQKGGFRIYRSVKGFKKDS